MSVSEISKRYAKALLAVAKQKGIHSQVLVELSTLVKAFSSDSTISSYFSNPIVAHDKKAATVKAALSGGGVSEELLNTLLVLADKNRLGILDQVYQAYQDFLDEENGLTRGVVRSAQPLTPEAQGELEGKITKILNKKIVLTYQQDTSLLGGAVAQVGGWTFDDSIEMHLKKLNEELNRRAN